MASVAGRGPVSPEKYQDEVRAGVAGEWLACCVINTDRRLQVFLLVLTLTLSSPLPSTPTGAHSAWPLPHAAWPLPYAGWPAAHADWPLPYAGWPAAHA